MYISGPMSGLPKLNYPAFFAAEQRLSAAGLVVLNPASALEETEFDGREQEAPWELCMRLSLIMELCADWIYQLDGWEDSKGARVEKMLADLLGIKVLSEATLTVRMVQQLSVRDIGCRNCGRTKALTGKMA